MIVSVLRKEARENLKSKWKKAFFMMFTFYIVTILIEILKSWLIYVTQYNIFVNILGVITNVVINYGLLVAFIKLKRNEKVNVLHFIYFAARDTEKVWKLIGRLVLKLLIPFILLLIFLYLSVVDFVSLYYGYGVRLSFFIEIIATLGIGIYIAMKSLYYSLMNYVLCDNIDWKAKDVLKESKRLMQSHRWDFIKLNLSFAGWFLLAIVFNVIIILALIIVLKTYSYYYLYISYIPMTFLFPYLYTTMACFYDNLLYNNPRPKEEETVKKSKKKNKKSK